MRRIYRWRMGLLAAWAALVPGLASAQDYSPPDPVVPLPLYSSRPEEGGFYTALNFVLYRQTNPLKDQPVAYRGFVDVDGSIAQQGVGAFIGSRTLALDVHQVSGPNDYQPGFKVDLGWKFQDGSAVTFAWMYLTDHKTSAAATGPAPPGLQVGPQLADSFLTSFVFNFPSAYAGPDFDAVRTTVTNTTGAIAILSNPHATYGIWDASTIQTLGFTQRVQQYDITYRKPVYETDDYRMSALVGPRFFWIWEKFQWITTAEDFNSVARPTDVARYTNIDSNRMYGIFAGCSNECYLGHGFACMCDLETTVYLDIVKERAKYELGQKYLPPQAKRSNTDYTIVPEFRANVGLMWYPIEGVQIKIGYDVMAFLNTIASPNPISFNYGSLDPQYTSTFRLFDGFNAGIAIIF